MRLGAVLLSALVAACATGPSVQKARIANHPAGADITVWHDGGRLQGELLEVSDSAFLVRTDTALVRAPFSAVNEVRMTLAGSLVLRRQPSDEQLGTWRALSRFPAGVPDAALSILLSHHRQTEPHVLR